MTCQIKNGEWINWEGQRERAVWSSCWALLVCCGQTECRGGWGLTSVEGPQADVGLPVEVYNTCWPCGGVENVPLLVPGSLVMCCQLTLHIQVRHRCQRETDQVRQQLKHVQI